MLDRQSAQTTGLSVGICFVLGGFLWVLPFQSVQAQQVVANSGNTVSASGTINTTSSGTGGYGLYALNSGVINATGPVFVTTSGSGAHGAHAWSGGLITLDGGSIATEGAQAKGLYAFLGNARIMATNMMVSTQQNQAKGAEANVSGHIVLNGGSVTTLGDSSEALYAIDQNATLSATGTTVSTSGVNSHGVHALIGVITLNNVDITTTGQGAVGARVDNESALSITDSKIMTHGVSAVGVQATKLSTSTLDNVTIATEGELAVGVTAQFGANLTLTGGSVTTTGPNASGLFAVGLAGAPTLVGAQIDANGVSVSTSGVGSHAAVVRGGSAILLANSTLTALGPDSHGLYASAYDTNTSTATLVDSSVSTDQGAALRAYGTHFYVMMDHSTAIGGGAVLSAAANAGIPATLTVVANNHSVLTGVAQTEVGSRSDFSLADGSVWNMTGDSVLNDLTLSSSAVLSTQSMPSAYKTLTIENLNATDGVIGLNTYLADDDSPSDQVVINGGAAAGQTRLRIRNTGGAGAPTTENGIQVITAINGGQTGAGAFSLDGRAVAGPYEYRLYRSGSQVAEADNWYLRSQKNPEPPMPPNPGPPVPPDPNPPVPPNTNPPAPPGSGPSPEPLYRPEVAAYLANQRLVGQMFVQSLHDRLGEPQFIENGRTPASPDTRSSAWLRSTRTWGSGDSKDANFHVDTDIFLLQGGGDIAQWGLATQADRIHVGAMLGYGVANSKARADANPARARGKVEGYNAGLYATWFQNDKSRLGAYADLWAQYGWFKSRVEGDSLPRVDYDSHAWSVSAETGYAFQMPGDWVLEPQAQVIYVRGNTDSVTEENGTHIGQTDADGVIARLGVRTHRSFDLDNGRKIQPFATVNWWHTHADSTVSFDELRIGDMYPKDRVELKLGANADLAEGWTGWVNIAGTWGAQNYHQYGGRIGVKYTW